MRWRGPRCTGRWAANLANAPYMCHSRIHVSWPPRPRGPPPKRRKDSITICRIRDLPLSSTHLGTLFAVLSNATRRKPAALRLLLLSAGPSAIDNSADAPTAVPLSLLPDRYPSRQCRKIGPDFRTHATIDRPRMALIPAQKPVMQIHDTSRQQALYGHPPQSSKWLAALSMPTGVQILAIVVAAALALPALYLVKSALGIDLMPGPSPLHSLLYHLLGRG